MSLLHFCNLSVAVLCGGCGLAENYLDPEGPRYTGAYAADPAGASSMPKLEIVTFNIQFGEHYQQAGELLAADERLSGADILFFQEMDAPRTDAIAERLGLNYVYYPGSVHENGRDFGNAVLARWPIVSDKKLILPHRNPVDGRARIAVQATVATPLGDISTYSIHTETPWLGPRARLDQARSVVDDARASELMTIAGGDFNTSDPGSQSDTVALFRAAGFDWASNGAGATAGVRTLDYIFVRRLDPLRTGTVSTEASDHRAAWAEVEVPLTP